MACTVIITYVVDIPGDVASCPRLITGGQADIAATQIGSAALQGVSRYLRSLSRAAAKRRPTKQIPIRPLIRPLYVSPPPLRLV